MCQYEPGRADKPPGQQPLQQLREQLAPGIKKHENLKII